MSKSSAGKGDSPRNCFSKQFKNNYEEIKWGKISNKKVNKYPEYLLELLQALFNSPSPVNVNDNNKIKDFDIYPENKNRDALYNKYNLNNSIKEMYVWEVIELMYNHKN